MRLSLPPARGRDAALAIARIAERDTGPARMPSGYVDLGILILLAVPSIVLSLFSPDYAMLPYLINVASPLAARGAYRG